MKFTKDHEWITVEGDLATVGITDFAQSQLGDIVYIDITSYQKALRANDIFGSIEAVKTVSDLFLPVSGTIMAVNPRLENEPEQINNDPFGEGWIITLQIADPKELDCLLDEAAYEKITGAG